MKRRRFLISPLLLLSLSFFLFAILATGCKSCIRQGETKATVEPIQIKDYGTALFSLDTSGLEKGLLSLTDKFSFFTGDHPDTSSVSQIKDFIGDPFNQDLYKQYSLKYPDLTFLEEDLTVTFNTVKSLNPDFRVPEVFSYVSGLLYESPVSYLDSILIIGLDMYLGSDFELYRAAGLPKYMVRRMDRQYIVPECARQIALSMLPEKLKTDTFLDHMILHGKILYAMDRFLPGTSDTIKIGYTASQMEWCIMHEKEIWMLFIDQEMLYRTDDFLLNRFIQDGPFTSGLPEGSPAMLGRWIGWQIVRSYMKKNPDIDLRQLFELDDAQKILSLSGYKPKK